MTYPVAEKFKSIQGEGIYAGTPMAFIRFVGCSVGKRICQHCDTDFDKTYSWRGGGEFSAAELLFWAAPYRHICLTGGEPLNQDLTPLFLSSGTFAQRHGSIYWHIETSGTVRPDFIDVLDNEQRTYRGDLVDIIKDRIHLCVSPKVGFQEHVVRMADEVKVIVPGLGEVTDALRIQLMGEAGGKALRESDLRWPSLSDALRWAASGKTVFLQPRNAKFDVDKQNLLYVMDLLRDYPQLRLSAQMHKILKVQ